MPMRPVSRVTFGCGLVMLLSACLAMAQPTQTKQPPLPDGLRHVPPDALGFIHFRTGDFLKSTLGKTLLQELRQDREASKGVKEIEQTLGIEPADLESVTLLLLTQTIRQQMSPWDVPGPARAPKNRFPGGFDMKRKIDLKLLEIERILELEDKKKAVEEELEKKKAAQKESPVLFQDEWLDQPFPDMDPRDFADYFTHSGPLVIVTSIKPLDRKRILRSHIFAAKTGDRYGPAQDPSVLFLSDRTAMIGAPWQLGRYSELMAREPGPKAKPLQSALAMGAKSHLVVAGGNLPAELRRMVFSPFVGDMRALAPVAPLFQTEAGLALDLDKSVDLTLQFSAPNEASAANALQAVKSLRVLAELAIEKSREAGESGGTKLEVENALIKALAGAKIEQKGTLVRAELKLELGPAFYKKFTKDIVAAFRQRGDRTKTVNNLKEIGLALHAYHDVNGRLPPAGIGDRDGKPLLSWRVAILPYIEQNALYQQFDLNQPWDHPTNKKLIARMPATFAVPGAETKEGMTHFRVLVGGGAMFDARTPVKLTQIIDGTSNTFMVVEAKEPTIWTRPDDLPYDPKGPLPKFGVSPDGFNVLMGDASVRFVRSTTPQDLLRAYITRAGGEVVPPID